MNMKTNIIVVKKCVLISKTVIRDTTNHHVSSLTRRTWQQAGRTCYSVRNHVKPLCITQAFISKHCKIGQKKKTQHQLNKWTAVQTSFKSSFSDTSLSLFLHFRVTISFRIFQPTCHWRTKKETSVFNLSSIIRTQYTFLLVYV